MLVRDSLGRLVGRLKGLDSGHKRIARDMSLIMGFVFLAKIVAAAKEMAVAWRYGISNVVDAYLFVFNLVSLPIALWFSILSVVYIPLAATLRAEAPEDMSRFREELLGFTLLVGTGLGILAFAILTGLFHTSLSGLPVTSRQLALSITPWLVMLIPLGVVIHYGSVMMMSQSWHGNSLFEGIPAVSLLIFVLLFISSGPGPLVAGVTVGCLLQLTVIMAYLKRRQFLCLPRFSMKSPAWQLFWAGMSIMLVGQVLQSLTGVIDQFFAAHLNLGSIATLGYSNRILSLILTLGATAVARATLPIFSSLNADKSISIQKIAKHWSFILAALGGLVLLIGWPTADWAVQLLFQRGAFTAENTLQVSDVLRFGLLQIPFYFGSLVLFQALLSRKSYKVFVAICLVNLMIKITASFIFVPIYGLKGLVLSTAIMYAVAYLILFQYFRHAAK